MSIPTLSLHTLGDLFVPFSMEQIYKRRTDANGASDLLVQRAYRDVGHCGFTITEQEQAFAALTNWVVNGVKPAGDDVITPAVVAAPTYGCAFSVGAARAGFRALPIARGQGRVRADDGPEGPHYFAAVNMPLTYSRVMRAMFEIGISFGQTASHSPSFEQLPKPSASAWSIIATTRRVALDLALRQQRRGARSWRS